MLSGYKTYIAAFGLLATGVARYLGHEIDLSGLFQVIFQAAALAGLRAGVASKP